MTRNPLIHIEHAKQAKHLPRSEHLFHAKSALHHIGHLLCIGLSVTLATASLVPVYGSLNLWTMTAVPATSIGCLLATLRCAPRRFDIRRVPSKSRDSASAPLLRTLPIVTAAIRMTLMVTAQFVLGPLMVLQETPAWSAPWDALAQGWRSCFESFGLLIGLEPPLGRSEGALMSVWTLCLWTAFLTTLLSQTSARWTQALMPLPVVATMTLSALLGVQTPDFPYAALGITVMALLLFASVPCDTDFRGSKAFRRIARKAVSALTLLTVSALTAACICSALPAHRLLLRELLDPPYSAADRSSPLSSMRFWPTEHRDDVLLTVTGLPAGTPVRLAVMDRFDGNVWNLSESSERSSSSSFLRPGERIKQEEQGRAFTATFTIGEDLKDIWVPLAGAPTQVDFKKASDDAGFHINAATDTGVLPDGLSAGTRYIESGVLLDTPTNKQITKATNGNAHPPAAQLIPKAATRMAAAIAGGAGTAGAKAQALADYLSANGWFSHGSDNEYPSLPGHGNHRIASLLAEDGMMVGDSEQYASAMALMARELGLASRVVMGFMPKERATPSTFIGADMKAWVEVCLEGLGWVAFDPTPPDSRTPDPDQTLSASQPRPVVRQPRPPLADPAEEQHRSTGRLSASGNDDAAPPESPSFWTRIAPIAVKAAIFGSPIWLTLLAIAIILTGKAWLLARSRTRGSPSQRIGNGWQALTDLAADCRLNIPASLTRSEQTILLTNLLGRRNASSIPAHEFAILAAQADAATFSSSHVTTDEAVAYWNIMMAIRRTILASQTKTRRWRARLSIRLPSARAQRNEHMNATRRKKREQERETKRFRCRLRSIGTL